MMGHPLRLLGWFAGVLLGGSLFYPQAMAAEPSPSNPPQFNEKELFSYKPRGHAAAAGQVFLSAPSGKAFTQAGVSIYMIPTVTYTRHWFDRNIRVNACSSKHESSPSEHSTLAVSPADCMRHILAQLLTDKRFQPYLRTTRANPTGHFWFTKVPAGRYYIVSFLEGGGNGPHKEEHAAGMAWLTIELEAEEKATNLVLTDCKGTFC
ncbi:MAG: hypothetical protein A4E19_10550 [Nitrospira sp. SG-bin1]|nr:MAG: hypothetical protein A4E19_10550 [Nitrospira sp. SG-bin1]